jgi:hypothetical protein
MIIRRDDGAWIPNDQKNPDYREYQSWLSAGGVADPYIAPPATDPVDAWDIISFKIAFNHENRIRALEGKAPITATQFRAAVKAALVT